MSRRLIRSNPELEWNGGYARVPFYDPNARPKRVYVYLGTRYKDVARLRFRKLIDDVENGRFDPWREHYNPNRPTLQQAYEQFVDEKMTAARRGQLSEVTAKDYKDVLRLFVESLPADIMMHHLCEDDVLPFIFQDHLSLNTQAGYYRRVNTFFIWACDRKRGPMIEENPVADIPKPATQSKLYSFLSRTEFRALLNYIQTHHALLVARGYDPRCAIWLTFLVRFAVASGLRRSELLRLKWRDIDFEHGFIRVVNPSKRTKTKSRGRERLVPIFDDARAVLDHQANQRKSEDGSETVFLGMNGKPLYPNFVTRQFTKYRRAAGLPEGINVHSLRHTFASWLVLDGVPLTRVQEWMGHQTHEETLIYAHLRPESIQHEGNPSFPELLLAQ